MNALGTTVLKPEISLPVSQPDLSQAAEAFALIYIRINLLNQALKIHRGNSNHLKNVEDEHRLIQALERENKARIALESRYRAQGITPTPVTQNNIVVRLVHRP